MTEIVKSYIQSLFKTKGIEIPQNRLVVFNEFGDSESSENAVKKIIDIQNMLMDKWKLKNRVEAIIAQQISIPNATVNKPYQATFDFQQLKLTDLISFEVEELTEIGLAYDKETKTIAGTPIQSGDIKIKLLFNVEGEQETEPPHEKVISLIINPDPKTLWKDIPSDTNAIFWKKDDDHVFSQLSEKHIVIVSKRGRSHKNVGSFRDDDFAFKHFPENGWSVVVVADGAGSYALSRQGSKIACNAVIEYFAQTKELHLDSIFENKIQEFSQTKDETILRESEILSKQILYKATTFAHNKIRETATETYKNNPELFNNPKAKSPLDYFHSTLIFTLYKKYEFGYLILTFGVGDCPIAIMDKKQTETKLLNWLDVGEFGGGTRFITQSEIFHSNEHPMASRFNFHIITDFSYLFLMTDGIYDPKFVVEANLEKHEKWIAFLSDLSGNNEEHVRVEFNPDNKEIENQLLQWMDFWSLGNHDDRTLAVIF
jgi:serine/threonine protein phosphatase PrpC